MARIPQHLSRMHVLKALDDFRAGVPHGFAPSRKLDLIHEGQRFPPKAIFSLAVFRATGQLLTPDELSAGNGSTYLQVLRACGFAIVPKTKPSPSRAEELSPEDAPVRLSPLRALLGVAASEAPAVKGQRSLNKDTLIVEPPPRQPKCDSKRARLRQALRIDYAEKEARNRALGEQGEKLVLLFERRRLCRAGRPDLAAQIRHVSFEQGDGLGYDIQSYEVDGRPLHIEVKATCGGPRSVFFISENELAFSDENPSTYCLYRVYRMATQPRVYLLKGSLRDLEAAGAVYLRPREYIASV